MKSSMKFFLYTKAKAKVDLELIEDFLIERCANTNAEKIKHSFASMDALVRKFGQVGLWNPKKRICPKTMKMAPNLLKQLHLRTYQNRLQHRNMKVSV